MSEYTKKKFRFPIEKVLKFLKKFLKKLLMKYILYQFILK